MDTELIMFHNNSEIAITVDNDTIGEYTCVATNMLGSDLATSFVNVKCWFICDWICENCPYWHNN